MNDSSTNLNAAVQDFRTARQRANMQQILARITGKSTDLLDYEEVRRKLRASNVAKRGLQEVPLDAIVGSVGRVGDFTRSFLPKLDSDEQRWAGVKTAVSGLVGLPAVEMYQLGDAYFVIDGNHRVSIARQMNSPTIEAYVTVVASRVPLSPDDDPDQIIAKARYVEFLEQTNLDQLHPDANLLMTLAGQYRLLLEHIEVHHYYLGLDWQRDVSYAEAVSHWYESVYLPIVYMIRERGVLRDFPERTETDIYLLVAEHRAELEEVLGWELEVETAVSDLASQKSSQPSKRISRIGDWLLDAVTPDELEAGPPPGQWRKERVAPRQDDRLFTEILVVITGEEADWRVLDIAIPLARAENGRLLGLHVVEKKQYERLQAVTRLDEAALIERVRVEFERRCEEAGVNGRLAVEHGNIARQIVTRAAYADLIIVPLNHPPSDQPIERLTSGIMTLLKRSPRPIITVPVVHSEATELSFDRILLAYNGTPKAREALFIAAYLAANHQVDLTILALNWRAEAAVLLDEAKEYLAERGVTTVRLVEKTAESPSKAMLETAVFYNCNLLLIGGFRAQPIIHAVLGSNVDTLLRESHIPILISR